VLGTSALRDAVNRDAFLERVSGLGLDIEVLSGEEEAKLGVLAVANGFDLEDAAVMDLGGGSAQVSLMQDRRFASGRAYPLGAVRLSERFLFSDPPKQRQVAALEAAVESELGGVVRSIREMDLPLVACWIGFTVTFCAVRIWKLSFPDFWASRPESEPACPGSRRTGPMSLLLVHWSTAGFSGRLIWTAPGFLAWG
jgi:hypothetical protein